MPRLSRGARRRVGRSREARKAVPYQAFRGVRNAHYHAGRQGTQNRRASEFARPHSTNYALFVDAHAPFMRIRQAMLLAVPADALILPTDRLQVVALSSIGGVVVRACGGVRVVETVEGRAI